MLKVEYLIDNNMKDKKSIRSSYAVPIKRKYSNGGNLPINNNQQGRSGIGTLLSGLGGASPIGMGVSMVGSMLGQNEASKAQDEVQALINKQMFEGKKAEDAAALKDYKVGGSYIEYYANGGQLPSLPIKGKVSTKGGNIIPISSNADEVIGNTHGENTIDNSYGVTMMNPMTGQPEAEVEDGEVIVGNNYVFSDRLKHGKQTFATVAKKLNTKRAKIEAKLNKTTDSKDRNGYERQLAGINIAENELAKDQEFVKMVEGRQELQKVSPNTMTFESEGLVTPEFKNGGFLPKYALGGGDPRYQMLKDAYDMGLFNQKGNEKIPAGVDTSLGYNSPTFDSTVFNIPAFVDTSLGQAKSLPTSMDITTNRDMSTEKDMNTEGDNSVLANLAPNLLDNVSNFILTKDSPRLPAPIPFRRRALKTTINVNPQIAATKRAVSSASDNINLNTSDSSIARANITSAKLRGAEQLGDIYANKENSETQLINQDKTNQQAIDNANIRQANDFANANFTRTNDIQSRISANIADFSKNIGEAQTRKDMQDYYDEVMLLELLNDKTGDKARVMKRNPYFARTPRLARAIDAELKRLNR